MPFLYQDNEDFETTRELVTEEAWEHIDRLLKKPPQKERPARDSMGCLGLTMAGCVAALAWLARETGLFNLMVGCAACAFVAMGVEFWLGYRSLHPKPISFEEKTTKRHNAYDHLRMEGRVYVGGVSAIKDLTPTLHQIDYWYVIGPDSKHDTFVTASQTPLQEGDSVFVLSDGLYAVLL